MAIDLLQSFIQRGNQISSKNEAAVQGEMSAKEAAAKQAMAGNQQILRAVRSLQAGQTLQGEIMSVKGDQVQLEILKQVIIDARLSGALNLTQGTNMTFQVKGNQGGNLSLVPLFTNVSTDPNVLKALDMAGLSVNERTTQMVQNMMEKGMSINKQSLMDMYREVVSHKDAPVSDIVSLKQMGMAVTEDNLTQYSLYKNNQHFLTEGFLQMGKELAGQLGQWVAEGKTESAVHMLRGLVEVFETADNTSLDSQLMASKEGGSLKHVALQEGKELLSGLGDKLASDSLAAETESAAKASGVQEKVTKAPESFQQLLELVKDGRGAKRIAAAFERIWGNTVKEQWLLKPEEIGHKDNISRLYEKLETQVKHLEQVLEEQVSTQSNNVAKVVHNTSANLDFMHQMNQMHAYIQLPLKMMNQQASGDLYVFTNKRAIHEKEGKVTALLHLDMEYLGKMDIHVALEDSRVATQFYLEKEEYLDFLEKHMELLSSRLKKRGYECTINSRLRQEETNSSMISRVSESSRTQTLLSTQAFDMRA